MTQVATVPAKTSPARMWSALGVVYVVWGSTYLGIHYAIQTMPPLLSAGVRFLLAGTIALVAVRAVHGRAAVRATRGQLVTGAVAGLLLLLGGNGLLVIGEERVPTGLAALVLACVPLWMIVLRALLRDLASPITLGGVLLGLVGVGVLLLPGGGDGGDGGGVDGWYLGLIVLGALSWSAGSLLTTRRSVPADPFFLTAVQMLAAGVGLTVVAVCRGELRGFSLADVSLTSWLALAYLVVFGSLVAFTAYVWVLGHAPVSIVSTYAYVNPAVAVGLGVLFVDERLTGAEVIGGLVILLAVGVVVTEEGRRARRARREARDPLAPAPEPAPEPAPAPVPTSVAAPPSAETVPDCG